MGSRRGPAPRQAAPFTSLGQPDRCPSNHTDLCDHAGDITSIGGQQEGVGVFGKLGEGAHILLCHRERGGSAAVLGRQRQGSAENRVPPGALYAPSLSHPRWSQPPGQHSSSPADEAARECPRESHGLTSPSASTEVVAAPRSCLSPAVPEQLPGAEWPPPWPGP